MLLNQISASDPVTNLVLTGLGVSAPILQDVQFYANTGNADSLKKRQDGELDGIFRAINANNTARKPVIDDLPVVKKIVSFDAQVDVVYEDRNVDVDTELAQETKRQAIAAGYQLQEKIFEGSTTVTNEFNGLRRLVAAKWLKTVATNGIVVPVGNSDANVGAQQIFIEELLKSLALVRGGAGHAYMNEFLKIRMLTVAKHLGFYRQSKDELGNLIEYIGNTVIRGAGYKEDGTPLLPFDETVGEATNCSSIFLVRWGEGMDLTALTSVGVKARYAGQVGNFYINNVNLDMALALPNEPALVQVKGWRLE